MIDNLNSDEDLVSVKQLIAAAVAIVLILSLWNLLASIHIS